MCLHVHVCVLLSQENFQQNICVQHFRECMKVSFMACFMMNFMNAQYMCSAASVMSNSATPQTVVHQAPLSMEFSKQDCWSGLPFPSPGDLLDPGIKPGSPALQADSLDFETPWKHNYSIMASK